MSFTIFLIRLTGGWTVGFEMQCASQKFCIARFRKNNVMQGARGVNYLYFRGMMIGIDELQPVPSKG
jgi:hypothetical protein